MKNSKLLIETIEGQKVDLNRLKGFSTWETIEGTNQVGLLDLKGERICTVGMDTLILCWIEAEEDIWYKANQ